MSTGDTQSTLLSYSAFRDDMVQELVGDLSETEVRALHAKLRTLGTSGWLDWFSGQLEACERYLMAPPAKRRRLGASVDERPLVVYGAIACAQLAGQVSAWFDCQALCEERDSRHRRAARGALLWRGSWEPLESWPFDEPQDLDDPFSEAA